jgi:hypothetical protein
LTAQALEPARIIDDLVVGAVQNPFPLYDQLRETGTGAHWSELLNGWVFGRYNDIRHMGAEHGTFSSETFFDTAPSIHDRSDPEHRRFIAVSSQQFMFYDPPHHTRIRSLFRKAFTRMSVEKWRPAVEAITDDLLGQFEPGQELDIMPRLAADLPVAVIAAILGVPRDRWGQLRAWSDAFGKTLDPGVTGELRDRSIHTSLEMMDYLDDLLQQRAAQPRDDLISVIATTPTADGTVLERRSAIAQVTLLLAAGNETTTTLIGNGMSIMIEHPWLKERLRAEPTLMPTAVEEMLRYDPPFHLDLRKAAKDTELGGQRIRAGQVCYHLLAAANRDPRRFPDPLTFDLNRTETRHLSFSHGIHFCLGASLARLEGQVAFGKILARFPNFTAGSEPPIRRVDNIIARGWESRPVRL